MGKYEIAVFDVDGTLLDTTEGVLASVKYTIDKMGFEPLSEDVLKTFIGPSLYDSFTSKCHVDHQFRTHSLKHIILVEIYYRTLQPVLETDIRIMSFLRQFHMMEYMKCLTSLWKEM